MSEVDPFIQPIPRQFQQDRELRNWTEYLNRFLHDIWIRTGGGDDAVSNIENETLYDPGIQTSNSDEVQRDFEVDLAVAGPDNSIEALEKTSFEVVSTSTDLTTIGRQIIVCTNTSDITITLNSSPDDTEEVHVIVQNTGIVTISGTINGQSSLVIGQQYDSPHLVYTEAAGEWNIV